MSTATQVKDDYDRTARQYASLEYLPTGVLEAQLIAKAIGDATDLFVLDIGGGGGIHARQAVDAGAKRVDIVDLSPRMLKVAQEAEKPLERNDRIRFYEADVSKPLNHLPLDQQYEIVMANWVFDPAGSVEVLEGMWRNIATYLKPGGKFLGVRVANLQSDNITQINIAWTDKYGTTFKGLEAIPGGVKYKVVLLTDPAFDFEGTSMDASSSGSMELHHKYGLIDIETIPYEETEVVKADVDFWNVFLQNPFFTVVKAKKQVA
jgi:SAM-dependent methyltransferase